MYTITTAKGRKTGTLAECWAWQEEYQGAFATVETPDGLSADVSECESLRDVDEAIEAERV